MKFPDFLKLVKGEVEKDDGEEVTMLLHEPVGFNGWDGMSAKRFGETLNAIPKSKKVTLSINCLGGDVNEGIAMHNMLLARGSVTTCVVGYAASMASVIMQAGATRRMMPGTMVIIHNPSSDIEGDHRDMTRTADFLKKVKNSLVDVYAARTKLGKRAISDMMDETTVMDGTDAMKFGFCDEVSEGSPVWNEFSPAKFATAYREIIATSKVTNQITKPSMKLIINALAALVKLPADTTDELAAPQVENAVSTIIASRDSLKTENDTLKAANQKHADALKLRVTNRVQAAIDGKFVKAERKDSLIAIGLADETALDFLSDISIPAQGKTARGAAALPPSKEDPKDEMTNLRNEIRDNPKDAEGNAVRAKKLRELRGHANLFAAPAAK